MRCWEKSTDTTLLYKTCVYMHMYVQKVCLLMSTDILVYICTYKYLYINIFCVYMPIYKYVACKWLLFHTIYTYITSSLYFALFPLDIAPRFRRAPRQLLCVSGPKHCWLRLILFPRCRFPLWGFRMLDVWSKECFPNFLTVDRLFQGWWWIRTKVKFGILVGIKHVVPS